MARLGISVAEQSVLGEFVQAPLPGADAGPDEVLGGSTYGAKGVAA